MKIPTKRNLSELGDELEKLEKRRGKISPKLFVDAARPKSSPLHKYFEWNNTIAGEKWRIEQAKFYLRTIKVYVEELNVDVRRFMTTTGAQGRKPRGYNSTTQIMKSKRRMSNMLAVALEELRAFQDKYAILTELCEKVEDVIRSMKKK